jgi:hypothetical protein
VFFTIQVLVLPAKCHLDASKKHPLDALIAALGCCFSGTIHWLAGFSKNLPWGVCMHFITLSGKNLPQIPYCLGG